jgi:hypothetical protein
VLVVPRHDPGRGVRLDPCTAMCGYTPSFTKQKKDPTAISLQVPRCPGTSLVSLRSQVGCGRRTLHRG